MGDSHQGWLADSSPPSACNRAGSPNPNSWRRSQRVPRPPWSLWVSGQRDGGAGCWVLGWGCRLRGQVQGWGVQGELCHVPLAALAHTLLFLCLFCLSPSSALAAACCCSTLLSGSLSSRPLSPCPHASMCPVPLCPNVPILPCPPIRVSVCPCAHAPCPCTCMSTYPFVPMTFVPLSHSLCPHASVSPHLHS